MPGLGCRRFQRHLFINQVADDIVTLMQAGYDVATA